MNPNSLSVLDTVEHLDLSRADTLTHTLEAKVKSKPNDLRSLLLLGNTYYLQGRIGQSIGLFEKALAVDPQCAQAYYYLGVAFYRSGRVNEAIQALSKVAQLAPSLVMAYYWLGIAHYHKGHYAQSRQAFETLLEKNKESVIAHYHAALACMADQAYEKAREHLEALVQQRHRDPQVYVLLGQVYYRLHKIPQAESTYKRGLELNPDNAPLKHALEFLTDVEEP